MEYKITQATRKIAKMTKRIRAVQGGTSASKTISILLYLVSRAQADKVPTLTSVISESVPHLKRGAIRDFKNIMIGHGYWEDKRWNATDCIYSFHNKSQIEFFSADNADKLRGGRRQRLFINEANNNALDVFNQTEVRTEEFIFLDWNPTNEFWFYTEVLPPLKRVNEAGKPLNDVEHIILTYKDCEEVLPAGVLQAILARQNHKSWWKVYGLGQLGEVEGIIYRGWDTIDEIPHQAKLIRYGLDFGFTNDLTAIVAIYEYLGGLIINEITFMKGLSNKQIADILIAQETPGVLVVADSAEPKSIAEIKDYGVNIVGVKKKGGKDSTGKDKSFVRWSIEKVQDQRISVTKKSINVIHGYRNYMWKVDRDGKVLNEPDHLFSDAMDAIRYGIVSLVSPEKRGMKTYFPGQTKPLNAVQNTATGHSFQIFGKGWNMKNRI